jgi:hypothetical protein
VTSGLYGAEKHIDGNSPRYGFFPCVSGEPVGFIGGGQKRSSSMFSILNNSTSLQGCRPQSYKDLLLAIDRAIYQNNSSFHFKGSTETQSI